MKYLLSIIYLICTNLGVLFMKLGGDSLHLSFHGGFDLKMGWLTFLGFVFYLCSFILWQKLLVTYNLSTMVPILTGVVQIITVLIGVLIFKEQLNMYNIMGIILIISGVMLIAIKGN